MLALFFPHSRIAQVPLTELRARLIDTFGRWGKPGAMRVDNGVPLGDPSLMTTPVLALWLIAVDIDMIWNAPHHPQQNGRVEKMQHTTVRWAEAGNSKNLHDLEEKLSEALRLQRECYPVVRLKGRTRLEAFPALETSRRPYTPSDFELQRVHDFLSKKLYTRKVAANGQILHYRQVYYVGWTLRHHWVQLRLRQDGSVWQVFADYKLIKEIPATHLSEQYIQNLTIFPRTYKLT